MRILKMILEASVFIINSAHKNFHRLVQWTSLDAAINSGIYFVSYNYDSSDIEFDTVMKIVQKKIG